MSRSLQGMRFGDVPGWQDEQTNSGHRTAVLPRLNFLEVTPGSGGYQLSGVFQNTVTPPNGGAFTFFVTVRPPVGLPFRVARLPDGSGAAQRSNDGGITWNTFAPATAQLSGQDVSVTVGQDAGLTPADDVSVGWESVKPDQSGAFVESGSFSLGSLAGQAPTNTLLMPRLSTVFVRGLPSGFQTCALPDGARPLSAVFTPGSGITLHFPAPPSQGTITVGDAPNFESTLIFNYLTGNTAGWMDVLAALDIAGVTIPTPMPRITDATSALLQLLSTLSLVTTANPTATVTRPPAIT